MFILKFALEISILVILYLMLRRYIFKNFGSTKSEDVEENPGRGLILRGAYSFIFLILGIVLSFISFWIIYGGFSAFHSLGNFTGVLVTNQMGLVPPSLIFGFYASTFLSRRLYSQIFGEDQLFVLDKFHGHQVSPARSFKMVFTVLTLIPAVLLLVLQFNVYLKIDGNRIYTKEMLEQERIYSMADVVSISPEGDNDFSIYLANGDKISIAAYSGNINYFLDNLSR